MGTQTLDAFLPIYETRMVERVFVPRPREVAFAAFHDVTPREMPLARILATIRSLATRGPKDELDRPLADLIHKSGWLTLAEIPPDEVIVGVVGRFWRPDFGMIHIATPEDFFAFHAPGYAKVIVSYRFLEAPGGTEIVCETRVHATGRAAQRRFRWYWRAIGLGAHLTVRSGLKAMRRRAERSAA